MNHLILLGVFYYEILAQGSDIKNVFLSVDGNMVKHLKDTHNMNVSIEELEEAAKLCIASGWLERTTADPYFNFLSMTENGLQHFLDSKYRFPT